jgi:hypothetical protein
MTTLSADPGTEGTCGTPMALEGEFTPSTLAGADEFEFDSPPGSAESRVPQVWLAPPATAASDSAHAVNDGRADAKPVSASQRWSARSAASQHQLDLQPQYAKLSDVEMRPGTALVEGSMHSQPPRSASQHGPMQVRAKTLNPALTLVMWLSQVDPTPPTLAVVMCSLPCR